MQIVGHCGSRVPGPENTPQAVRAAVEAGADGCEIDVRRSSDDVLVCVHDPVVAGLTVVASTARQLSEVGVPLLTDMLIAAGSGRLLLEVKNIPGEPDFTKEGETSRLLVQTVPRPAHALVSSFNPTDLDVARDAGWPTGLLTLPGVPVTEGLAYVRDAGYDEVHAHVSTLSAEALADDVRGLHDAGKRLALWTLTTMSEARSARALGVDAVICDDPAGVVAELVRR